MLKNWYYSLFMLGVYVSTFAIWKLAPSRASFLLVGSVAIASLIYGLLRARRRAYFANRLDLTLHGWVIADLVLESTAFEAFKVLRPFAVMEKFHDNMNFLGCALTLSALVGGYRWFALRSRNSHEVEPWPKSTAMEMTDQP